MIEDNAPSYFDLRDSKFFFVDLEPYQGSMNEIFDGELLDEVISTNLYYLAKITSTQYRKRIPNDELRIFQRLKDRNAFNRVHVSFDTLEWDSGIDLDPEFVYSKSQRLCAQQDAATDAKKPRG